MNYAKNLPYRPASASGFVTRRLPGKKYQPPRRPILDMNAWRAKWQNFYAGDLVNKLIFGFYAAVLFLSGYVVQECGKSSALKYIFFYLPAAGCLWLAINSAKILQTSRHRGCKKN
ncbi:MAG: hypothetical protein ACYC9J_11565 [Sulfuricaulis sp.]